MHPQFYDKKRPRFSSFGASGASTRGGISIPMLRRMNTRNLLTDLNQAQIEQRNGEVRVPLRERRSKRRTGTKRRRRRRARRLKFSTSSAPGRASTPVVARARAGDVANRNAHAQIMIHGSKPISATIGNYNAVYRVLKGTPHEWMLERHLEPKRLLFHIL